MKARAALAEAQRQLDHTVVRAPFDGIVTAVSSLQPGTLIISAMSAFNTTSAVGLVSDAQSLDRRAHEGNRPDARACRAERST